MYSKPRLTKKQKNVLEFIKMLIKRRGFPPTVREIMKYFGYRSPRTVQDFIKQLVKKKRIKLRYLDTSRRRAARGIKTLGNRNTIQRKK